MIATLRETDFDLPYQTDEVYRGKVGDTYSVQSDDGETLLAVVRTDRISAFDVVLPATIPHKGQILSQMSAALLRDTAAVVPNWLIATPDPNVTVGYKAEPFGVEMIMRGALLGTAWRNYQAGMRDLCGNVMPEGMTEFEPFARPLLTPTTKAKQGHDEDITPAEIVASGLASQQEFDEMEQLAQILFAHGRHTASTRGLVLADTKYEFGRLANGKIIVIDEVHTPDSSRYFPRSEYLDYLDQGTVRPEQLSKEFVREWLVSQGFSGQDGQQPPNMSDEFRQQVSERYASLYEKMTDQLFVPATAATEAELQDRVRHNLAHFLIERFGA